MMLFRSKNNLLHEGTLAAVDLGSNSFHMIVAHFADGKLQVVDRLREMVRLRAGLDENQYLSPQAQQRALECLQRFAQRLKHIPAQNIRIVGTNTLRSASNATEFLIAAQNILGHPIQVISGIEEARLIYLGVAYNLAENGQRRLVFDIGGGSTEIIIGENFKPTLMESLPLGCVSMTQEYFANGKITDKKLTRANLAARLELESCLHLFTNHGWEHAVGASGTVRSVAKIVKAQGWSAEGIDRASLGKLRDQLLSAGSIDNFTLTGLSDDRRPVFLGGFIVLEAIFQALQLEHINVSDGAVREGLIYDLTGKISHHDVREETIKHLMTKYLTQQEHAVNVAETAEQIRHAIADGWQLRDDYFAALLKWAALLHEIGLAIAHDDYQNHSAYLAKNSDLPGFSMQEQQFLSLLIKAHRQKIHLDTFETLPKQLRQPAIRLAIILRLAVILHRSHTVNAMPEIKLITEQDKLVIIFPQDWLAQHALTFADLNKETKTLKALDYRLQVLEAINN